MSVSPIKVTEETRRRVALAAAIYACTQGEFVERAVAEYLEANKDDLRARVTEAQRALAGGDEAMVAYLRGESS